MFFLLLSKLQGRPIRLLRIYYRFEETENCDNAYVVLKVIKISREYSELTTVQRYGETLKQMEQICFFLIIKPFYRLVQIYLFFIDCDSSTSAPWDPYQYT